MKKKPKGLKAWYTYRDKGSGDNPPAQYSPFTVVPEGLETGSRPSKLLTVIQRIFSTLFLVLLGIALLALVAAFGYTWITTPDKVVNFFTNLVSTVQAWLP